MGRTSTILWAVENIYQRTYPHMHTSTHLCIYLSLSKQLMQPSKDPTFFSTHPIKKKLPTSSNQVISRLLLSHCGKCNIEGWVREARSMPASFCIWTFLRCPRDPWVSASKPELFWHLGRQSGIKVNFPGMGKEYSDGCLGKKKY